MNKCWAAYISFCSQLRKKVKKVTREKNMTNSFSKKKIISKRRLSEKQKYNQIQLQLRNVRNKEQR